MPLCRPQNRAGGKHGPWSCPPSALPLQAGEIRRRSARSHAFAGPFRFSFSSSFHFGCAPVPFFVHVDEFQTFSSDAFASLLSEARKFGTYIPLRTSIPISSQTRCAQQSSGARLSSSAWAAAMQNCRRRNFDQWTLVPSPISAWLRRGIGRDRIFAEPKLYDRLGTAEHIREQSRQRFGRSRAAIEHQRQLPL